MKTTDYCQTCGNPRNDHPYKHPFNDGSLPASATFGRRRPDGTRGPAPTPQAASQGHQPPAFPPMPFDPVLRQALIDRGILTPEDLQEAEAKIRAVTATFHQQQEESND